MPEETITPATPIEPSFAELRTMLADPVTPVVETPEKQAPAEIEQPESGTGDDKIKQPETVEYETQEERDVPAGVKKRKATEKAKQDQYDAEINREVALTKSKKDELAKLKTGNTGSEPAPNTAPAEGAKPVRPSLAGWPGTAAEYDAAVDKYDADYKVWLQGETRKTVTAELAATQQKAQEKQEYDDAAKKHGAEFPALMKSLIENTSPELQRAISVLDDWSGVAVHLAKPANAAERTALVEKFAAIEAAAPDGKVKAFTAAISALTALEHRLKPAAKPAAEKPLPAPLTAVAGAASATGAVDLDKEDRPYLTLKRELERSGALKK